MIEYRKLSSEDVDAISARVHGYWIEIYSNTIVSGSAGIDSIFKREEMPSNVSEHMNAGTVYEDVAVDGESAGLIAYSPVPPRLYIDKLYLDSRYRGHGLGNDIIAHIINEGKNAGCTYAELVVSNKNPHAINFYERNGFLPKYVEEVPDGFGNTGYHTHMRKELR